MSWVRRAILGLMLIMGVFAGLLAQKTALVETDEWSLYAPIRADPSDVRFDGEIEVLRSPSRKHVLGTDDRGRDVAARLVHGARATLAVAFFAALLATFLAVLLGLLACLQPWMDRVVLLACDALAAVPALLLVLLVRGLAGGGVIALVVLISLPRAASTARLVRERLRHALARPYCDAAAALGLSRGQILVRHALPAAFPQLRTAAGLTAATAVLSEVALSFLGLGLASGTPSWGELLRAAHENQMAWWLLVPAGLCTTALAYALTSEFSRDRSS